MLCVGLRCDDADNHGAPLNFPNRHLGGVVVLNIDFILLAAINHIIDELNVVLRVFAHSEDDAPFFPH